MLADLRFALRLITKSPGFTLVVVIALGVGLGLATTTFTAFNAVMLRPVPHLHDESRVVFIDAVAPGQIGKEMGMSVPDYLELRDSSQTLDGLTLTQTRTYILADSERPDRVLGSAISTAGFSMLGAQPLHGRDFRPDDEHAKGPLPVIISHQLWQKRFGGADDVVGRKLPINGHAGEIIGIMPPHWNFPQNADLWTPFDDTPDRAQRGMFAYPGFARLKPGVTLEQAQAELGTFSARLAKEYPKEHGPMQYRAQPIRDQATHEYLLVMRLMMGAVFFVVLIACANVANLLLTRGAGRTREIAVRVALGASRLRIVRMLLVESLALGLLGGAAGLLLAIWGNQLLFAALPRDMPFWIRFEYDGRVFGFVLGASIVCSLIFGLAPAWHVARSTAVELREGGRTGTAGPRTQRIRQGLVVFQFALALVLLVGAGLMVRSFLKLRAADPGFDPHQVLTFRVGLPPMQFGDDPAIAREFFAQLLPKLREIPGVEAAGATAYLPGTDASLTSYAPEGQPKASNPFEGPHALQHVITPGLLDALRIPLLRGRDFTAADREGSTAVTLVSRTLAEKWFPNGDALGKRLNFGTHDKEDRWIEIVGVVGDVPQQFTAKLPEAALYIPAAQDKPNFLSVALRYSGDPSFLPSAAQDAALAVRKDIPIYHVQTMEQVLGRAYWDRPFFGKLFSVFGVGALFLASLGIYGVMAYSVTQRTQEIGVRMALGAQPNEVVRLISQQGFNLVGAGMVLGIAVALNVTHVMAGYLYGVSPKDPPTYFSLSVVLALVGMVATWLPARRATRIAPIEALRME